MASFSSSRNWRYHVFPSFSGEDVRRTFLSHLLKEFQRKGIETFIDHGIKRGQSIGPELVRAIRDSRISIVVLSKNHASSTWCLNELLEIMKCRETAGQTLMTIFYEVDPSNVRKQTGDFGKAFKKTCTGKTKDEKRKWKKALTDMADIAGEHTQKWDNEAEMIEKIARNVSDELNYTPSRDFDDLVGIETHMTKMNSLLCLESNKVRMIGIWGPAGIGKTTVARVLHNRLSSNFQRSCFLEDVKGSYRRNDLDDYGLRLCLQQRFLSQILGQKDLRTLHLGVARERLKNEKVLVVLDDVDDLEQLNALAAQTQWFGFGSRIIITTKDRNLLRSHGINYIYEMDFPSRDEALKIFFRSAFGQNSPPDSFRELALEVAELAGRLPLCLSVLGSSLRGKSNAEWILALPRLRTSLDGKIEKVLRVGYDRLHEKDKAIFLHIACLLNGEKVDLVTQLLADRDLDVSYGLKVLADMSLIHIINGKVVMHSLLQQVGREVVRKSSNEPGKCQFLVNAKDIYDVLTNNAGTGDVLGISLNMSEIDKCSISDRAFEGMRNLLFLRFYKKLSDEEARVQLPNGLENLPRKLRLLHWDAFPMKSMPSSFNPELLVEFTMRKSKVEKLWEGTQPLRSLKKMDLSQSENLKEIPDLSNATNLDYLDLGFCQSLVTLPSSFQKLNKLTSLFLTECKKLELLPTNINLESLNYLYLTGCSRLKSFPQISRNVVELFLGETAIEEVPSWIENLFWLRTLVMRDCKKLTNISSSISKLEHLEFLEFSGCQNIPSFPAEIFFCSFDHMLILHDIHHNSLPIFLPDKASTFLGFLDLSSNDFESLPDCIKVLSQLRGLDLSYCDNLQSLPEVPNSLWMLTTHCCFSLERVSQSFDNPVMILDLSDCFNLNQEAQELIQQSVYSSALIPGGEVPEHFTHRASGGSLTIHLGQKHVSEFLGFKACLVLGLKYDDAANIKIVCHFSRKRSGLVLLYEWEITYFMPFLGIDHLFIVNSYFWPEQDNDPDAEVTRNEILFEFSCSCFVDVEIIECGVRLLEACPSRSNRLDQPKTWMRAREEDESSTDSDGGYETAPSNMSSDNDLEMRSNRKRRQISPREELESDERETEDMNVDI